MIIIPLPICFHVQLGTQNNVCIVHLILYLAILEELVVRPNDVVVELFKMKCLLCYYMTWKHAQWRNRILILCSLLFTAVFQKNFTTRAKEVVEVCQYYFNCEHISALINNGLKSFCVNVAYVW